MENYYGRFHPDTQEVSDTLLQFGDIKANTEIQEIDGTMIQIRCIRFKEDVWYHHMEDDKIVEIFKI